MLNKRFDLNGHTVRFFRVTSWPNTLFWNVFLVQKFYLRNKGQIYAEPQLFLLRLLMCPKGYFRVTPSLCFKARLNVTPFIRKWIVILMQIKLHIRKFFTSPCFESKSFNNSEMAYWLTANKNKKWRAKNVHKANEPDAPRQLLLGSYISILSPAQFFS